MHVGARAKGLGLNRGSDGIRALLCVLRQLSGHLSASFPSSVKWVNSSTHSEGCWEFNESIYDRYFKKCLRYRTQSAMINDYYQDFYFWTMWRLTAV